MIVRHSSSLTSSPGQPQYFTGSVHVYQLVEPKPPSRVSVALVVFEPGSRTVWHSHPLGQTLVIVSGRGLVQRWGDRAEEVHQGDVVQVEPGEKHWHGAAPDSPMSHIAVTEALDGRAADWMEPVSDEQYLQQHRPRGPVQQPSPYADIAPALAHYTDHVLYGDVWNRPGLSPRDRSLVTVAALTALYRVNELPFHIRRAIENGVTKDEIVELITHLAFYSGWPTANTALSIARKVFEEMGVK